MYLQRRNGHYWFRKATPLDLLRIVGQAEIRCSLRTNRRDVANRRATQLLVAPSFPIAAQRSYLRRMAIKRPEIVRFHGKAYWDAAKPWKAMRYEPSLPKSAA